ncbi:NAD(P)H-dependent flavin oxidoreductase [Xanthovirga aplysinae]|uniref:NAD(P)H-dependent flavin oxidoreductase n=1 Tax=Xanthovirga aplysinae TaxID=2529853 RepID=UPI0012BCB1E8|nr:nitronate monooxygenase [Xanthovirga aplysinae]
MLGAKGVQIGSAFIASPESLASDAYKKAVKNSSDTETKLTKTFSGKWARGIKNKFMETVEESGIKIPPYPIQNSLTSTMRKIAIEKDFTDFMSLWAGQSAAMAKNKSVTEILSELIDETENLKCI